MYRKNIFSIFGSIIKLFQDTCVRSRFLSLAFPNDFGSQVASRFQARVWDIVTRFQKSIYSRRTVQPGAPKSIGERFIQLFEIYKHYEMTSIKY